MLAIGLDCSGHNVGWAVTDSQGGIAKSGVEVFKIKRGQSVGLIYHAYMKWLDTLVKETMEADPYAIVVMGYEVAHFRGGFATEMAVALQTRSQEIAAVRGCLPAPVHTATVKKFATTHGHAGKEDMIIAAMPFVKRRKTITDDEADAIHIARWAFHTYGVDDEILKPQARVFCDHDMYPLAVCFQSELDVSTLIPSTFTVAVVKTLDEVKELVNGSQKETTT